jgi:peptidoglycan hydrolase-like protein with peptidoglycan-binding domain
MTKRRFATPVCLAIVTSLLGAAAFAQARAAPAAPATAAPAASAPAAAAPSAARPASGARTHAMGHSQRVEKLQSALNASGATLTVDGKMGSKTHAALMDFQKAHGLKATGRPDKETRDALKMTG